LSIDFDKLENRIGESANDSILAIDKRKSVARGIFYQIIRWF